MLGFPAVAYAAAPTTTTSAATGITTSSAVLNGAGDPNNEATTGWFRYGANNPVTCNDTFGTRLPASSGTDLGTNTIEVPYSITATGLTPGVTYYFCSIVQNASGMAFGAVLSFTIPAPPVTLTTGATAVGSTGATLNGSANPVASLTTSWFRYATVNPVNCNDTFGLRAPTPSGGTNLGMGTASVDYNRTVGSLLPGTTYYYCAIAQNAFGTTFGQVLFFTTQATAPTVTTNAATSVTTTSAVINGTGIPRGDTTNGWFRYSTTNPSTCNDTFGIRVPAAGGTALGSDNSSVPFSEPLTGLSLATTYYVCAIAQNGIGISFGGVSQFSTLATAPTVTTTAVTSLTGTSATLNATGNPNGATTNGWFRYATTNPGTCNDSFGTRAPPSSTNDSQLGAGVSTTTFNRGISGLTPTTTYFYCALAQNSVGLSVGAVLQFTTPAMIPTVTTSATTVTSGMGVTFNGIANPNGDATTGWFRYATASPGTCNDSFGIRAPIGSGGSPLGGGLAAVMYSEPVTGLTPLTQYFVCAIAQNGIGTGFGSVQSFFTPAPPTVTTGAAANLTNVAATLNGTANPNRATTTAWFRYATVNPGACNDTFGSRAPVGTGGSSMGNGALAQAYAQNINGLSPNTTYFYCAIASNSEGMTFGTVLQFTTQAQPTVVTNAATLVLATSATLNGTGNPNGAQATGFYRYSPTDPVTCNDTFGTRLPASSGGTDLGLGVAPQPMPRSVTGLTPGTTYYYCAIANNIYGNGFGAVLSFTTPAAVPVVTTNAPTMLTGAGGLLQGTANPGGDATNGWFRYATVSPGTCNDSFGTRAPMGSGGSSLGAGTTGQTYSQAIAGLAPATTYYVCAIAQNSVGIGVGTVVQFITPAPPAVTTNAASNIANTSVTLNGSANPNRATTTGWFRYSASDPGTCNDTFGSRAPVGSGGSNLGAGASAQAYVQNISGLSPATTYYVCAIAQNSEGLAFGTVVSFITAGAPTVITNAPTSLTATGATLQGTANPNSAATTAWYRYSTTNPLNCSDSFGTVTTTTSIVAGIAPVAFPRAVSGLTPATTYYVCAIANNTYGTSFGGVVMFTTPAIPPSVTTNSPSPFTGTTATLNGTANPNGDVTTAWFRYDTVSPGTCNDSFGTRAPIGSGGSSLGSGITAMTFNQQITGLTQSTTYYVCAIAQNGLGLSFGAVVQFITAAPPVMTTEAPTSLVDTSAFLQGTGNPNRATTTAWFRYATVNPGTCNDTFGTRAPVGSGGTNLGAGASVSSYNRQVTGLSPGTTYYYCAIGSNVEGTTFGVVTSFTTLAAPTMVTNAPTNVTSSAATLQGTANPNGAATTAWYRYSTTNPGTCNDTFGTVTTTTSIAAGASPISFTRGITGLTPATTYYVCAIGNNTYGTSFGAVVMFSTPAIPPTVVTAAPSPFTGTTATLNGTGNPNGASATGWFRYDTASPGTCNDTFGTRAPAGSGGSALGAGITAMAYSQVIAGLTPNTTYFVCAIASNSLGTSVGAVVQFTTATAPTVTTAAPSNVLATTATLNGTGNPNRSVTTGWFRYDTVNPGTCNDIFGTRAPVTGGTNLGSGSSASGYFVGAVGLLPATTYYYCAIAQNAEGFGFGSVMSFTTLAVPTLTSTAATLVAATTATLNGTANPNGTATTAWFRYSTTNPGTCNDSFGNVTTTINVGAGITPSNINRPITGLLPGQTYYYCAIGNNAIGTGFGNVMQLTALAGVPTVATVLQTGVTTTTATLNGSANPNGASTTGWFRISTTNPVTCDDVFGTRVPGVAGSALGAGNSAQTYSEALTNLAPGTTYYYCAIANNSQGVGFGTVRTFATPAPPTVVTLAATPVTATTATLNATGNPNGFATTAWFRYATVDPGACSDSFGIRAPTGTGGAGLGSATAFVPFAQPLTNLTPGTTYFFCGIAQSSIGITLGELLSFTTPPTQPSVTTLPATAVDVTSATLEGTANPNGALSSAWFRYATVNPGTCSDSFGIRAPLSGSTNLGGGNMPVAFSQPLTGLAIGTTYYYCAIASNGIGISFGVVGQFTTASAPTVTTVAASAVTSSTATINGTANPNFGATTGWFRYATTNPVTCDDSFGIRAPVAGGTSLGSGSSAAAYNQPLTGLTPGTTYFYCAIASNLVGVRFGAVMSFATSSIPTVTTDAATVVAATTATLNGTANPNGTTATGSFRYATTSPGTCNNTFGTVSTTVALGAGTAPAAYNRPITGLVAGTTYFYCAIATNTVGTGFGAVMSFTTASAPTVTTEAVTGLTPTGVTFNGTANPNQLTATGYFRYATTNPGTCTDAFGTRAPATGGTALGAGIAPVPYSQPAVTTLTPATTYFYCAAASNTQGTRFGAVMSFITPAAPTVTTSAATVVTSTSATLNGSANPRGSAATGWFRYATASPGTCNDTFGTRAPVSGGTDLGAGTSAVTYNEPLIGLTPGTQYFFCAIASNGNGTASGTVLTFTTPNAPTVTTNAATAVGASTATLQGSANPNAAATTGYFRYATTSPGTCDDTFGIRAPVSGGANLGSGTTATAFNQPLTGLASGTQYFYCAIASNSVGVRFGSVLTFTTLNAPTMTTEAPTLVTSTTATLNGTGNPNGLTATGLFRYATTSPGTCNNTFGTATTTVALGAGTAPVAYSRPITGLVAGTTYFYCAIGSNSVGVGVGPLLTFTTPGAPTVTTAAATAVTSLGATLNGSANPNAGATTGWFRYATTSPGTCNDTFGTRAPASGGTDLGSGIAPVAYTQDVTGLTPGATYFFCAIASNASGTRFGTVMSFTATAQAPVVTTSAATAVTATGATLNGSANPGGATATGWFRYSATDPGTCDDTFGTRAPASGGAALGAGGAAVPYTQGVAGLTVGTTYYYCAIASNSVGTGVGVVMSFVTPAAPTVTSDPATAVTTAGATLNGTGDPNGAAASGWFRYSGTNPGTCDDTFGTRAPAIGSAALGAGTAGVPYAQAITGLAPATTYYYCAIASNAVGTGFGAVITVTTPAAPPLVTTDAPSDVLIDTAVLNGTVVPNGDATTAYFRYAATNPGTCNNTFGIRVPATGGQALGAGTVAVPYAEALTALIPETTYYACAIATNALGTSFGAVVTFQPGADPPVVTTEAATGVTATDATLEGTANPNGTAAVGWFRFGETDPGTCDDSFGLRAPTGGGIVLGGGTTATPFDTALAGLLPNATYYYCAAASNLGGASFGAVRTFTTDAIPPTVLTMGALGDDEGAFTLSAAANPQGADATGWFRYGTEDPGTCNDTFGTRTPEGMDAALGPGRAAVRYSSVLTELSAGTYFVCAIAANEAGLGFGEVLTFEVDGPPGDDGGGGCCAVAGGERSPWPSLAPLAMVLAMLVLRRRRRRA